jgi:hypothetical protein
VIAHRDVAAPAVLRAALTALLAGPTDAERAAGETSAIPAATTLRGVKLRDGEATVDLSGEFATGGGTLSMTARVTQVVFTATQFTNVDRVTFWIDGEPVETLGGEGLMLDEPQQRSDVSYELSGSVIIDSPQPGATVTSPIRVTGEGDVYEAQFPIESGATASGSAVSRRSPPERGAPGQTSTSRSPSMPNPGRSRSSPTTRAAAGPTPSARRSSAPWSTSCSADRPRSSRSVLR